MIIKRQNLLFLVGICLIIGIGLISNSWSEKEIKKEGLYTIIEISAFSYGADGTEFADYSFIFNSKEYFGSFFTSGIKVSKGSRFFLIFSKKDPSKAYTIFDKKVPDSIKFTPGQYWKMKPWLKLSKPYQSK